MTRAATLLAVLAALLAPAASARPAFEIEFLRMPSGNVDCIYSSRDGKIPAYLRCDIRSRLRPMPPKPKACVDGVWGMSVGMTKTGRVESLCISDTAYDPGARVLGYGTTWRRNGFTCTSLTTGLRCTNLRGHGFVLSRAHSRRF